MKSIVIDADAATGVAVFRLRTSHPRTDRMSWPTTAQASLICCGPAPRRSSSGPGGGWDVSRALASGSQDMTGVEINPIIAERHHAGKVSRTTANGFIFGPQVHIHVEDGRSFVRRSQDRYQVLQATLVDTWASTAAGAFALSENNLYTTERVC